MKKYFNYLLLSLFSLVIITSCNKDETDPFPSVLIKGAYVINYGSFNKGGSSISKYDYETGTVTNFYDQQQNGGTAFTSNIQYAYKNGDNIFLTGNSPDQLITLDPLFTQTKVGVTEKISKPRSCVAQGDYLYVSCWGESPDWDLMSDTYIAKYNIKTGVVDKTIALPGGQRGSRSRTGNFMWH